jgi:prevent-host-death family protein
MYIVMYVNELEERTGSETATIAEARTNLPALVKLAEQGQAIEITRRGKPVAMLLSTREYARLVRGGRGLWQGIQAFRREHDAEALRRLDVEAALAGVRDRSGGREVDVFGADTALHEPPALYGADEGEG